MHRHVYFTTSLEVTKGKMFSWWTWPHCGVCGVFGAGECAFWQEKIELRPTFGNAKEKKQKQNPLFFKPLWGFQNSKNPIMLSLYFKIQSHVWKHITLHGFNKKKLLIFKKKWDELVLNLLELLLIKRFSLRWILYEMNILSLGTLKKDK